MGYVGLRSYQDVDGASDIMTSIVYGAERIFGEALKFKGNRHNPPGFVNVALVLEANKELKRAIDKAILKKVLKALKVSLKVMEASIQKFKEEELSCRPLDYAEHMANLRYHFRSYKRMIKNLEKKIRG